MLLKLIMKQINLDIEGEQFGSYVFNNQSALALLYLLLKRADKDDDAVAKNMDARNMSAILINMVKPLRTIENDPAASSDLKTHLNKLFKKTPSGGKKRRSIKKKRQPKKNITIKKKYKKNKKLP